MPRVDLYCIIHKALRTMLFDTARCVAEANFADPSSAASAVASLNKTLEFLEEHNGHEDQFVEPLLSGPAPELVGRIRSEHIRLQEQVSVMQGLAAEIIEAQGPAALGLGAQLHLKFSVFTADYLGHMATEESEANPVLWENHGDMELVEARTLLQGSIPPERFAQWFSHMVTAMNWQERVGVLGGMKMHAPPPVFQALSGVARKSIGEAAWSDLSAALPS